MLLTSKFLVQVRDVRKPVNINPGLNVNWSIICSCKNVLTANVLRSLRLYYSSKLKGKQCKQIT